MRNSPSVSDVWTSATYSKYTQNWNGLVMLMPLAFLSLSGPQLYRFDSIPLVSIPLVNNLLSTKLEYTQLAISWWTLWRISPGKESDIYLRNWWRAKKSSRNVHITLIFDKCRRHHSKCNAVHIRSQRKHSYFWWAELNESVSKW